MTIYRYKSAWSYPTYNVSCPCPCPRPTLREIKAKSKINQTHRPIAIIPDRLMKSQTNWLCPHQSHTGRGMSHWRKLDPGFPGFPATPRPAVPEDPIMGRVGYDACVITVSRLTFLGLVDITLFICAMGFLKWGGPFLVNVWHTWWSFSFLSCQ